MQDYELSTFVTARISHDLVNPIGAISNGLDLMIELEGADTSSELAMVAQSATRLSVLIKFLRLAFGRASLAAEPMGPQFLAEIIEPVLAGPRISVAFSALDGPGLAPPMARLAALMSLAARASLGLQGNLRITLPGSDATGLTVTGSGPQVKLDEDLAGWIGDGPRPDSLPEPRNIEFALLAPAAEVANMHLTGQAEPGLVVLDAQPRRAQPRSA